MWPLELGHHRAGHVRGRYSCGALLAPALPEDDLSIIIYTTGTPQADPAKSNAAKLAVQLTAIVTPDQPVTL